MQFQVVGLRVTDFERSLRFYTTVLGFVVVARGDTRSWGGGLWAQLRHRRSGGRIELNWYPAGSRFAGPYAVGDGIDHLDFTLGVASRERLEHVFQRIVRRGARLTPYTPATTEGWMASVLDPDGIWITIGRRPTPAERRAMAAAVPRPRPKRRRTT